MKLGVATCPTPPVRPRPPVTRPTYEELQSAYTELAIRFTALRSAVWRAVP